MVLFSEFSLVKGVASLLVILVAMLVTYCSTYFRRMFDRLLGRVPPGPRAFPILGTIEVDHQRPENTFRQWVGRYGNLFSFFLGQRFCVGVGDINLIRKLFRDERFTGRSRGGIVTHLDGDLNKGIVLGVGDLWKEHRRFSISALRDFGFGKASGSENIQKEAASLLAAMKDQGGQSFDPRFLFTNTVANVVSNMLFSDGFHPDDPRFGQFVENVDKNMQEVVGSALLEVYPWLRKIYPFTDRMKGMNLRLHQSFGLLADLVKDHRKSFDPSNPRDYIDAFFCVQENNKLVDGSVGSFTDEQLVRNIADLFIAGYETTSTFLRWSMVYMLLNPQVQAKVQAEIDTVIGQSRLPMFSDKAKMPFTDAVTVEIHRITSFLPFGVPHSATEDVEFEGYKLPKGTEIWPLFFHHFKNPQLWGDPQTFRPERFIDTKGNLIASLVDEVQPFSVGRRACLGEPLARMEVFVFFASILQNFTLSSKTKPSTVPVISAVLAPQPFTLTVTSRS